MADPGPVVRVAVTPTYEDFARLTAALRRRQEHGLWPVVAITVPVVLLVVTTAGLIAADDGRRLTVLAQAVPIAVFAVFLFGWVAWSRRYYVRRQWKSTPGLREDRVFEFSPDGLYAASDSGSSRTNWPVFEKAEVLAVHLILTTRDQVIHYLPEAALSDEQRADLDDLLRAHVPGFAGLPARG